MKILVESRVADVDEENEPVLVVNHHVLLNESSLDPCCEDCCRI